MHVLAVERERNISFVVLEWLEGFPLVDLLRARRALTLREMLMLLKQIAPAVDAAREANLRLEMNLRNILRAFSRKLRRAGGKRCAPVPAGRMAGVCGQDESFGKVKELEASARSRGADNRFRREAAAGRRAARYFAYELLGGKRGGFAPLANCVGGGQRSLPEVPDAGPQLFTALEISARRSGAIATAKPDMLGPDCQSASLGAHCAAQPGSLAWSQFRRRSIAERSNFSIRSCFEEQCLLLVGALTVFVWPPASFGFSWPVHS